jgi:hypothetical protein
MVFFEGEFGNGFGGFSLNRMAGRVFLGDRDASPYVGVAWWKPDGE